MIHIAFTPPFNKAEFLALQLTGRDVPLQLTYHVPINFAKTM